jgi:NAD(P)-dependent dehydrogenase (short-subunit alcohol dehydrogenase family)/predicted GNAT family acetyltransferase
MKVVVVGATGTIGESVADALEERHEVIRASRRGEPRVDLADPESIAGLFASVRDIDAIVCCAASAPLTPLADPTFIDSMQSKLFGQVELARQAIAHLRDGGSITLTAGQIPEGTPGSSGGALVNAGLEAFVRAAAAEMPRGIRLNVLSPRWVRESLAELGMDPSGGIPVGELAQLYVEAVEGTAGPSRPSLRPATAEDVPRLTEVVRSAYGHYVERLGGPPRPLTDDYAEVVRRESVTVAERDGLPVGLVVLGVDDEGFFIDNVAVDPAQQGTGVGRALLEHAEVEARREGFDSIYLYTHELMSENLALYSRVGYVEYDRRRHGDASLVYLRKRLA